MTSRVAKAASQAVSGANISRRKMCPRYLSMIIEIKEIVSLTEER